MTDKSIKKNPKINNNLFKASLYHSYIDVKNINKINVLKKYEPLTKQ